MNKKEIQQIMAIVRPAIIALYGRQPLRLNSYNIDYYRGHNDNSMWIEVLGDTNVPYTLKVVNNRVKYLFQRELHP